MKHYRAMRRVVGPRVLEREPLGEIEIELDRRPLPFAADRIDELEIELRPVERPAAFIKDELLTAALENGGERLLRAQPLFRSAKRFVRSGGELDGVRIAEGLEHLIAEIQQTLDLGRDLFRRAEDVRIVLSKAPDAHHPVQHATPLVAIHSAELGVADREVAV